MVKVEVLMDERALGAKRQLNLRLVKLSWALFFILLGVSWILESANQIDNDQKWLLIYVGTGAILLSLNLVRLIWNIRISRLTIGIGALALLLGIARYFAQVYLPIWAAVVLIIGIFLLFEALRR